MRRWEVCVRIAPRTPSTGVSTETPCRVREAEAESVNLSEALVAGVY